MSEALIASLQKRLDELTNENASLRAENKDRRVKGKASTTELEQLREQVKTLSGERDTLDAKVKAAPNELQGKIDELTGQIRTRDHRDAFAGVKEFEATGKDGKPAKFKLNDGVSIDDVWQLTGYKPEGETPEGKSVAEQLGKALQARPYLFSEAAPAPGGATRPIAVQAREGGPGAGKSGTSSTNTGAQGWQAQESANYIPGRI